MTYEKFVFATDLHGDKQNSDAVDVLFGFIDDFKPHIKVFGGDLWDFRSLRRKASAEEQRESMREDYDAGLRFLMKYRPGHLLLGNHDQRLWYWRDNGTGVIHDIAQQGIDDIEKNCAKIKCHILPYHKSNGVFRIGHLKMLHGFYCGVTAARRHALVYGSCLFGHTHCFPTNSELLTRTGWRNRSGIHVGDEVLSLNIEGNVSEWRRVTEIHDGYDSDLLAFRYSGTELLFTKQHDMLANKCNVHSSKLKRIPAYALIKSRTSMCVSAPNRNPDYKISDDLLRLIGWITTEGCYEGVNGYRYISIAQSDKPKVGHKHIVSILEALTRDYPGLSWKISKKHERGSAVIGGKRNYDAYRIRIHAGDLPNDIFRLIPDKMLSTWMFNLSTRQFNILYRELMLADGHMFSHLTGQYATNRETEADIFQALCVMNGVRCSKLLRNGKYGQIFSMATHGKLQKSFQPPTQFGQVSVPVWCVSVADNRSIFVRQNGKVIATGNSIDSAPIAGLEQRVARNVGCLCETDMEYDSHKPESLRHANGFAYGWINTRTGAYHVEQSEAIDGKWIMPTSYKEF